MYWKGWDFGKTGGTPFLSRVGRPPLRKNSRKSQNVFCVLAGWPRTLSFWVFPPGWLSFSWYFHRRLSKYKLFWPDLGKILKNQHQVVGSLLGPLLADKVGVTKLLYHLKMMMMVIECWWHDNHYTCDSDWQKTNLFDGGVFFHGCLGSSQHLSHW